jgi:hypothetical protein
MRFVRHMWAALAALGLLVGCSQGDTVGVATSEIHPQVRVVSSATSTEVTVVLFRGATGFARLQLTDDEALTVRPAGGDPVSMNVQAPGTLSVRYGATLPAVAPGDQLVIALTRGFEADAPATRLTIPVAPAVTAPDAGSLLRPDQPFTVAWTPFDDGAVEVRFALTSCVDLTADEFDVVAVVVGLPGQLTDGPVGETEVTFFAGNDSLSCDADLLVGRVGDDVDPDAALGGLRSGSRIVREAPARPLTFSPSP